MNRIKILSVAFLLLLAAVARGGDVPRPAVLFYGGVHAQYVVRPLHEMGIEVDACPYESAALTAKLSSNKFNVVVVGKLNDADRKLLDDFMARGGAVLACQPSSDHDTKNWTANCEWLTAMGARPRFEVLRDSDAGNVVQDVMNCRLSFSSDVVAPVNDNVRGVLSLTWRGTSGCEPAMSYDLSPDWKVVVRGAPTLHGIAENRQDVPLQPWIPKELAAGSPPLLALRDLQKGRVAVFGMRYYWIFTSPPNCPTAQAMLTAGAGTKPSDWLRVLANTIRWLAEPSIKAGIGGASTPPAVLNPPAERWEIPPVIEWTAPAALPGDQPQYAGLIGARTALSSGKGTVDDYVREARAAHLSFIVFLEDSLKMTPENWTLLTERCKAASDDNFAAVPGLTYEDAQGNHLYAFSDQVHFPKPEMRGPDGRLETTQPMRSRAYFNYVNQFMRQRVISGFWSHKANYIPVRDYKLYNSFPIVSFENGRQIDDALGDFLYLQGLGGAQAALAFEFMNRPDQVPQRAKEGWRVVCHRPPSVLRDNWFRGALSFCGSGSQYITNGPSILLWQTENVMASPNGLWWRPDVWEFRLNIRVGSEVGLKSVTLHDGDQKVLRRWLPSGARQFEQQLIFSNTQQTGFTLIVEDTAGHKAVSMSYYNRNLDKEELICSDRCNFLGNSRLRGRDGHQTWTAVGFNANMGITPSKGRLDMSCSPAIGLNPNSPSLPIDGAPAGFPTCSLGFAPTIPGEYREIFATPHHYLISPEIGIGQADYELAYDPAELGAAASPLGRPYQQPQSGTGNAWSSWHRLIPTAKASGFLRNYACNWVPGEFRIGWHQCDLTLKQDVVTTERNAFDVMHPSMSGWQFFKDDQPLTASDKSLPFARGTIACLSDPGGAVIVFPLSDSLDMTANKAGGYTIHYAPASAGAKLEKGHRMAYQIGFAGATGTTSMEDIRQFARNFGLSHPGSVGYSPEISLGKQLDNYLIWRLDGNGVGIAARIPRADLNGLLPVAVQGLNENWTVQLLDKARRWPNHRALPIRDGVAWAELDLKDAAADLFIGHPVTASNAELKILVSWVAPGQWSIEVHNPTDAAISATLSSPSAWPAFVFDEEIQLPAGVSKTWIVKQ